MRLLILACLVASTGSPTGAAEEPSGSYTCVYEGTLGCTVGGMCIDSGPPQSKRFTLLLKLDSRPFPRIRLNGLDGHLERNGNGYLVRWHLGGLGSPKLAITPHPEGAITATFIQTNADGGYHDSSNFKCSRALTPILRG
jgi:hypothetical protein